MGKLNDDMCIKIDDKEWTIRFTKENLGLDQWGVCQYSTRSILIDPDLRGIERLDTIIHELLHACLSDCSEDAIWRTSEVLSEVLALGGLVKKRYTKNNNSSKNP